MDIYIFNWFNLPTHNNWSTVFLLDETTGYAARVVDWVGPSLAQSSH